MSGDDEIPSEDQESVERIPTNCKISYSEIYLLE